MRTGIFNLYCFFFSSRRRHTRYIGDWSSDVCSSDLPAVGAGRPRFGPERELGRADPARRLGCPQRDRSEERRVGKEGRSRGARYHEKKNRMTRVLISRLSTTLLYHDEMY